MLKHISGKANIIVDALSKRDLVMQESKIQVMGFDFMKDMYEEDVEFKDAFEACKNLPVSDINPWL